jgi:hypothetical protein
MAEHLTTVTIVNKFSERAFQLIVHVRGEEKNEYIEMNNYDIEFFYGKKAPPMRKIKQNTAFFPIDPDYPVFDMFYYDTKNNHFFCFRAKAAPTRDAEQDNKDLVDLESQFKKSMNSWIEFLNDTTQFYEITVLEKNPPVDDFTGQEKKEMLNIIYVEDLPLLDA